mmetsp:Transcript_2667/g.318  ORF Transcript_2667/g.318 Transcript_2667/m.318 type:complete len:84 (-) Transcript_2667:449-700(-)
MKRGESNDYLFYVIEGELAIGKILGKRFINIIKLGVGTCFGEESAILKYKNIYSIKVASEYAKVYKISSYNIDRLFQGDAKDT